MPGAFTRLQLEILTYLRRHANAAETAAGVCQVWLGRRAEDPALTECEQALQGLVSMRIVEAHRLPGDIVIYRAARNPGRIPLLPRNS